LTNLIGLHNNATPSQSHRRFSPHNLEGIICELHAKG
jgi:hypothetical protein